MRLLAVDFGFKRIGLAVGDTDHGITAALPNLKASGKLAEDAALVTEIAIKENADGIVVGIPKNPMHADTRMERICLLLVDRIKERGYEVYTVDEAFTSLESEQNLAAITNKKKIKGHVDGEAARLILEKFIHGQT